MLKGVDGGVPHFPIALDKVIEELPNNPCNLKFKCLTKVHFRKSSLDILRYILFVGSILEGWYRKKTKPVPKVSCSDCESASLSLDPVERVSHRPELPLEKVLELSNLVRVEPYSPLPLDLSATILLEVSSNSLKFIVNKSHQNFLGNVSDIPSCNEYLN